jgi:hypothetical protein
LNRPALTIAADSYTSGSPRRHLRSTNTELREQAPEDQVLIFGRDRLASLLNAQVLEGAYQNNSAAPGRVIRFLPNIGGVADKTTLRANVYMQDGRESLSTCATL